MKMGRTLSLATIFMMISLCATGTARAENKQGLLWKVSGNGLPKASYIFGTHHLVDYNFAYEVEGLMGTLDEVDQLYGELKLVDDDQMQMRIMQHAQMPEGVTYKDLLSEEDYNKLDEVLINSMGMGLEVMGKFKPGMISSMYTMVLYRRIDPKFNAMTHQAIDAFLQKEAVQRGMKCFGLEQIEDQIKLLFETGTLEEQAKMLACNARYQNKTLEMLIKLNELYVTGELDKMFHLAFDNSDENPCFYSEEYSSEINQVRNEKWLVQLPKIFADKPTLVVVGALHLAGDVGLITGLREMGYNVERVEK